MSLRLPALPYALGALEPHISRRTLANHYGHHHATYVEKTRLLVQGSPLESAALDDIVLRASERTDRALFNAAAQSWNHAFYWRSMRPGGGGDAHGPIMELIRSSFGSYPAFCRDFTAAAGEQFGSGWAWLVVHAGRLQIRATADADTPLITSQVPVLAIDVWEHAYYLDYQYRRPAYVATFLASLVNWEFANQNLQLALSERARAETGALCSPANGAAPHRGLGSSPSRT